MDDPIRLALIYGSVRPGRFCDTVVRWVLEQCRRITLGGIDLIDPAAEDIAAAMATTQAEALQLRIAAADAFVIVTPEYNHSFPGPLKTLIDSVYDEWHAKPVAFVSYGGASGGVRAVEHLRGVFAELHAVGIRDGVSFPNVWETFGSNGRPRDEARYANATRLMLERLRWWAGALKAARLDRPYMEVAA